MFDVKEQLRKEQQERNAAAAALVRACRAGDVDALRRAVDQINAGVQAWPTAMRRVAALVRSVSPEIRTAFCEVWIESSMLPFRVGNHRALCDAARVLLPRYRGPRMRLFRGAGARERRCHTYGVSWSADIEVAERFAQGRRNWPGGGVLLETLAPARAIISKVEYSAKLSEAELRELRREHPSLVVQEFHREREYVVDRRRLDAVVVVRRYYPQANDSQ